MKHDIPSLLLCAWLVLLTSCVQKRELTPDHSLLGEPTSDEALGITYQMPAGFQGIRQSTVDSIASLELQHDPFSAPVRAIFVDTLLQTQDHRNTTAVVRDMRRIPGEVTENQLDHYQTTFNLNKQWDTVERQTYCFGIFPKVVQIDLHNQVQHLTRLYFFDEQKAWFTVDYVMPSAYCTDLQPYVTSSIASFGPFYQISLSPSEE